MYLERLLQINMATLAALGALLLGMGERSEGPPLLVALAAATSVWLTDIRGWFRLGRRVADVLMLLAAVLSLGQAFPITNELQALDLAWFLVYLQVILLFRAKDEQTYWLLVMLSLLQVVVATLFNQGIWFGMLLAVYMLLGFSAMTLLLLYRQWHRHRRGAEGDFVCLPGGESHAGLGRELFGRLGRMALHTLILAMTLFFVVPRLGQTTWCGAVGNPRPLVGYSDTVKLGELGEIVENGDEVMRVRFFDREHDNPRPIRGDIYLQGAILMTYDKGHWQAGLPSWNMRTELLERPDQLPRSDLVWQEITVEGLDHNELFFVAPFVRAAIHDRHQLRPCPTAVVAFRAGPRPSIPVPVGDDRHRRWRAEAIDAERPAGCDEKGIAVARRGPHQEPAEPRAVGQPVDRRIPFAEGGSRRPSTLPGAAARRVGAISIQPDGPGPQSHDRPHRGFRHPASARALRILCYGA